MMINAKLPREKNFSEWRLVNIINVGTFIFEGNFLNFNLLAN